MYKINAYHCDHCKKYSSSKGVITKHEKVCFHNPSTRSCVTCEHIDWADNPFEDLETKCLAGIEIGVKGKEPFTRPSLHTNCANWEYSKELKMIEDDEIANFSRE